MGKVNVVLVTLNRESLETAIEKLNLDSANVVAIITDTDKEEIFPLGEEQIPISSFAQIQQRAKKYKGAVWMIGDYLNNVDNLRKTKKFLTTVGVPEENIVNFENAVSPAWLANLRHVEKHGADFFATGNEYMRDGLNLKFIPRLTADKESSVGVNLADVNQNLQQSYITAKYVFEHVESGKIKFVLIGLSPESFFCNDEESTFDFECILSLATTAEKEDLNFDNIKETFNKEFSASSIVDWKDKTKPFSTASIEKNIQTLKDYIEFCLANGAKPVGVVFPLTKAMKKIYTEEFLKESIRPLEEIFRFKKVDLSEFNFSQETSDIPAEFDYSRQLNLSEMKLEDICPPAPETGEGNGNFLDYFRMIIHKLEESYDFSCVDMLDIEAGYDSFCDMTHLNRKGMLSANSLLSLKLCNFNLIPVESFCEMTYEYFNHLSRIAPKEEYHSLIERVFDVSARKIRRKDKVKIGFVVRGAAEWCGDELYNLFAQNARFEMTVFCFMQLTSRAKDENFKEDFLHGIKQFKQRNLNVVAIFEKNADIPAQDLLIFLTPYFETMPAGLRPENITAKTLIAYITYSFSMAIRSKGYHNREMFRISWKVFFASAIARDIHRDACTIGLPRGIYSGYPRTDIFFDKNSNFQFEWKMARPNAKKIIWAPHWSINSGVKYATFQWNCHFLYEFAKAHPEISWVFKPHPNLLVSAVKGKVFPSANAFEEYLQKWNKLPNACLYTGAYYQAVFATSDGMIQDSSSFIAEYQFVDKPMIYLTREGEKFNQLAEKILKVSYTVDGKDFDGIAALIKKVFIEGNDYKAAERKKVFDKFLNYPKLNGMLASEFIYKSIADEITEESK